MNSKYRFTSLFGFLLIICVLQVSGQKFMKLDTGLKENSTPMAAKRKGISTVGKYEFGPYRIVSGKGGVTNIRTKTGLISNDTEIRSENRYSFVFVGNGKDTVIANISENSNIEIDDRNNFIFRKIFNWSDSEIIEAMESFVTNFSPLHSDAKWDLVLVYPIPVEVDGYYQTDQKTKFHGILSDGSTEIEIRHVDEWEDGKTTIFNPTEGFEFFINSRSIAAVQVFPINKMFVWIHQDMNEDMKLVLATAAAALMVKTF